MVRYQCVSGYVDGEKGEYEVGQKVEGIGEVQSIEVLYGSVVGGDLQTLEEVLDDVRQEPAFSRPDHVSVIGSDGTRYTGDELLELAGVENLLDEDGVEYGTPDANA
jgi:hypothetical protein